MTWDISDYLYSVKLKNDKEETFTFYGKDLNFTEIRSRKRGKCYVFDWNLINFTDPITYMQLIS